VSPADQVLPRERASDRQRRETKRRIRQARHEGRISPGLCEIRRQSASDVKTTATTADLKELTSDLGQREGTDPLLASAIACCLMVGVAAWEPVFLSGFAWLALALPVTVIMLGVGWLVRMHLVA
jgi:Flp pilus assembly protein TadB